MKLYRLGNNEIRIHLTPEDLEALSIALEDFDYDSTKGRRVIWELFDRAKEETGFDAAKEKVYIQLYPKKNGGCELFVTKIEDEEEIRDCFSFESFEEFYTAIAKFSELPESMECYRFLKSDTFLVLIPSCAVPPYLAEYGEKLKDVPSRAFLKSRCKKIHWNLTKEPFHEC